MKLTHATLSALEAMTYLAAHEGKGPGASHRLAPSRKIPAHSLLKIHLPLVPASLLISVKGTSSWAKVTIGDLAGVDRGGAVEKKCPAGSSLESPISWPAARRDHDRIGTWGGAGQGHHPAGWHPLNASRAVRQRTLFRTRIWLTSPPGWRRG